MFMLDVPELIVILVIVCLLFARRMPDMGELIRTVDQGNIPATIRETLAAIRATFTPQFFISLGTMLVLFTIAYALMLRQ